MPMPLSVSAATNPETCVPCHELLEGDVAQRKRELPGRESSARVSQSPGSEASASRPSPSLAVAGSLTMSYPGSRWPPAATESRSGCS